VAGSRSAGGGQNERTASGTRMSRRRLPITALTTLLVSAENKPPRAIFLSALAEPQRSGKPFN